MKLAAEIGKRRPEGISTVKRAESSGQVKHGPKCESEQIFKTQDHNEGNLAGVNTSLDVHIEPEIRLRTTCLALKLLCPLSRSTLID